MALTCTTPATATAVSAVLAKLHVRETGDDQNALVHQYLRSAEETVRRKTNRGLMEATYKLTLNSWPRNNTIYLNVSPVRSIESVKYYDVDGVQQTIDNDEYLVTSVTSPARLVPAPGLVWPVAQSRPEAIEIVFKAGYAAASDIPAELLQAVLLLFDHSFNIRAPVLIGTIATPIENSLDMLCTHHYVPERGLDEDDG